MRKLITISILMLAVIGAGIYENYFISKFYNEVADRLELVVQQVHAEEYTSAEQEIDSVISDWEEKKPIILLFNKHDSAHAVFTQILTAKVYISHEQKADAEASLETTVMRTREAAKELAFFYYNVF